MGKSVAPTTEAPPIRILVLGLFAGPRGELWFAGHSRSAPEEMRALARELQSALRRTDRPTPHLDRLLAIP